MTHLVPPLVGGFNELRGRRGQVIFPATVLDNLGNATPAPAGGFGGSGGTSSLARRAADSHALQLGGGGLKEEGGEGGGVKTTAMGNSHRGANIVQGLS